MFCYDITKMGLFGRHGGISNFFRKASGGARRAFTKSKGLINRVANEVAKVTGDATVNKINDIAGKVINNPLTGVAVGVLAPELLPAYLAGKTAYNTANLGFQTVKQGSRGIEEITHDHKKDRAIRDDAIQRAKPKKRVVTDRQKMTFL